MRTLAALRALNVSPESISAIFLTHEHGDHVQALKIRLPFPQRYGITTYAPKGVWDALQIDNIDHKLKKTITVGKPIQVAELQVSAFAKPHDTFEPVGYLVSANDARCAVVTDLGEVPSSIEKLLEGCEYFIFESNHDPDMERSSGRGPMLIERVLGPKGHLSNQQAARALSKMVTKETQMVMLGHLSIDCNTPGLAYGATLNGLKQTSFSGELLVLPPDEATPFLSTGGAPASLFPVPQYQKKVAKPCEPAKVEFPLPKSPVPTPVRPNPDSDIWVVMKTIAWVLGVVLLIYLFLTGR
jgi:phosphoribosyl 1,2-cyclic phosphodiesterase